MLLNPNVISKPSTFLEPLTNEVSLYSIIYVHIIKGLLVEYVDINLQQSILCMPSASLIICVLCFSLGDHKVGHEAFAKFDSQVNGPIS